MQYSQELHLQVSSVQFSHSVVSDSLQLPWIEAFQAFLSLTNSQSLLKLMSIEPVMPSNHLIFCHPLLFLPSSFPASGSFPTSRFFPSGGQTVGPTASASALPMDIQDWFALGLTDLISLKSKSLPQHHSSKALILWWCFLYDPTLTSTHDYWKNHSFD